MDNIRERIQKILNLGAADSGATEEEQDTAIRLASSLAMKHGIDLAEMQKAGAPKVREGFTDCLVHSETNLWRWKLACLSSVEKMFLGHCYYLKNGKKYEYRLVVRKEFAEVARSTFEYFTKSCYRLENRTAKNNPDAEVRWKFQRSFLLYCASRLYARVKDYMNSLTKNDQQAHAATSRNALVVLKFTEQEATEREDYMVEIGLLLRKAKQRAVSIHNNNAATAGWAAGAEISLNKQIQETGTAGLIR